MKQHLPPMMADAGQGVGEHQSGDMSSFRAKLETNRPIFHIEVPGRARSKSLDHHPTSSSLVNVDVLHLPNLPNRAVLRDLAEVSIVAGWRDLADPLSWVK